MLWIILGVVALLILALVLLYNRLVSLRNRVENAWAQVDVQLKRRYDLIPNLVETVKGYASHERETFEAVTAARTRAHVEALAAKYERARPAPWVAEYDVRRLAGIVGIDIRVKELEGKFKLSQNRSAADRTEVAAKLLMTGRDGDAALARLMAAAQT